MRRTKLWIVVLVAAGMVGPVYGQPIYQREFKETYTKIAKFDCAICHRGKEKQNRTAYGQDLTESLGVKNQKDEEAILKAFRETETKPCGTEKKTYGDYLLNGEIPPDWK